METKELILEMLEQIRLFIEQMELFIGRMTHAVRYIKEIVTEGD